MNKINSKKSSVDQAEVEKFSALAEQWWDESGKFKPLHQLNPVRIKFIRDSLTEHFGFRVSGAGFRQEKLPTPDTRHPAPLRGISLLDIGCGGGLLAEPLTRLGAKVTGIDASDKNIKIASLHAKEEGLDINYLCTTAEDLAESRISNLESGKNKLPDSRFQIPDSNYEVVIAMEIIEHVADVPGFIESCSKLVKPGGLLFFATLNRTVKSYAMAIIGAEYVLRWLPRGTHDWNKFLRPSEIVLEAEKHNMKIKSVVGVTFNPLNQQWLLSDDTDVNYMLVLEKN